MDFLEKLNELMERRELNKSSLSKACDIPYTTIDNWYKRGYEGLTLPTLKKLATYFGTTLDFWATDEPESLSFKEKELLNAFQALTFQYQDYILQMTKELVALQSQQKKSD